MTELQRIELEMLRAFIEVCGRLGLHYYLMYGTMLGAVRHGGFIPWDDDVDVGLFRAEYEVFLREGQRLLPEGLFLQTCETDPAYPNSFAKLRDSRTTFLESAVRTREMNHGVYIDIFPLDYYPEARWRQRLLREELRLLFYRQSREFTMPDSGKASAARALAARLLRLAIPDSREAARKLDRLFRSVPESSLIASYCGGWGEKEIAPAAWYGEGVELSFEGLSARVPTHYDKWLTHVYGDYRQLPPEEKRRPQHDAEIIDTQRPYTAYFGK